MSDVELNEKFLQKIGGWQAVKEARGIQAAGKVLSASWSPPNLTGEVQGGAGVMKSGLLIKDHINVDNLCTCKESRQWGRICGHSLAVALEVIRPRVVEEKPTPQQPEQKPNTTRVQRELPTRFSDDGVPLELRVIIPPNIESSLMVGGVSVFFEGMIEGRRMPLSAVATSGNYSVPKEHQSLLLRVLEWSDGDLPATLKLTFDQFGELIGLLPEGCGSLGRKDVVEIVDEPFAIPIQSTLLQTGEIRLEAKLPKRMPLIIPGETSWAIDGNRFARVELPTGGLALLQAPQVLGRHEVPGFLQNDFPVLATTGSLEANFSLEDFEIVLEPPAIKCHLEGGLARLRARVDVEYFPGRSVAARGDGIWLPDPDDAKRYRLRDVAFEQNAVARLVRRGFEGPDKEGRWQLNGQDAVLEFFARDYPRLQDDWEVTLQERLDWSIGKNIERIEPRCEVRSSGEQWFDFGVRYETDGGEQFSTADIQSLLRGGRSHQKLANGKFALLDTGAVEELNEFLVDAAPRQNGGGYSLRNEQASFFNETIGKKLGWQIQAPSGWRERSSGSLDDSKTNLGEFENVLRQYQKDGVRWLFKIRRNGFGGILADEMGLGKTLQALALVALSRAEEKRSPVLVICPTSLVHNWADEASKFAPQLKVLMLHGARRQSKFPEIVQHDLVITSYALARRDALEYPNVEFDTVILDEAQHIKNRESQNAQAVKAIRCRHRLVLTGTPMENSVLDLWSIFDFLMPGYLGSAKDFRERYELPLSKGSDPAIQDRLSRRVRPFILRRLKRDVARDLPDKLEQVTFCDLTNDQRSVYEQVLQAGRQEVLDAVGKDGFGKSRMVIFNALLRLRQICCDLRLLKLESEKPESPSGKLDSFGELLDEVIDGGHRVLVFSQFTSMLDLLGAQLGGAGVEFCRLDGGTRNRGEMVRRFQTSNVPVFLISLKAGGVGLNLTAADTVVHFDPWWNPAVEDQATDRAHRIGQTRVVTSYKLIARDTIEEKILKLQQKKREAIKAVFGDEGTLTDSLSWDEVQELFA